MHDWNHHTDLARNTQKASNKADCTWFLLSSPSSSMEPIKTYHLHNINAYCLASPAILLAETKEKRKRKRLKQEIFNLSFMAKFSTVTRRFKALISKFIV